LITTGSLLINFLMNPHYVQCARSPMRGKPIAKAFRHLYTII